jgi:hypothetical protein
MKRNWYGSIGTVSHATMRTEDLIPSFLWEAKHLRLTKAERKEVSRISKASDVDGYYETEDADFDLNESLFNILDNHSLPYFYFGAHPGDGSDYGWWLVEEIDESFDGLRVSDTSEVPTGFTGEVLHINDHGNMTLYSANRGRLYQVWAIV